MDPASQTVLWIGVVLFVTGLVTSLISRAVLSQEPPKAGSGADPFGWCMVALMAMGSRFTGWVIIGLGVIAMAAAGIMNCF